MPNPETTPVISIKTQFSFSAGKHVYLITIEHKLREPQNLNKSAGFQDLPIRHHFYFSIYKADLDPVSFHTKNYTKNVDLVA